MYDFPLVGLTRPTLPEILAAHQSTTTALPIDPNQSHRATRTPRVARLNAANRLAKTLPNPVWVDQPDLPMSAPRPAYAADEITDRCPRRHSHKVAPAWGPVLSTYRESDVIYRALADQASYIEALAAVVFTTVSEKPENWGVAPAAPVRRSSAADKQWATSFLDSIMAGL